MGEMLIHPSQRLPGNRKNFEANHLLRKMGARWIYPQSNELAACEQDKIVPLLFPIASPSQYEELLDQVRAPPREFTLQNITDNPSIYIRDVMVSHSKAQRHKGKVF
eukprot:NODE_12637_length_503_cov_41.023684_g12346_i0.p1 GENE.NODE_12637_length_503_cov_41.023684_g12346_i0~~NODE_12637_length_503_cov_41.023684_g12346_i0.p1  ORF type:complete len:107 (+),score=11.13 NODE_12637_length_503_cov_41.023684_g12346_i0:102-422(+)